MRRDEVPYPVVVWSWYVYRKQVLMCRGEWEEPPDDVPEAQWLDALWYGYTDRYRPLPPKKITEAEYEKMKKEMYND